MTLRDLEDYKVLLRNIEHYENELDEVATWRKRLLELVNSKNIRESIEFSFRQIEVMLKQSIKRTKKKKLEIERAVDSLEGIEKEVLHLRYIQGLDWNEIFEKICYCNTQTHHIKNKAFESLGLVNKA
jgi:DNA-directed RNA polymerase specialized sigma subunit